MALCSTQRGLTLLEVLIALSLFAMIGVSSYRVLSTVSSTQDMGDTHSQELAVLQKSIHFIDRDLQQLVNRDIRISSTESAAYLTVNSTDYAIEITRVGWSNPLMLSRSSLQRVAYDIGPHPDNDDKNSPHYQSDSLYLRRHYWTVLDRREQNRPITQVLMPDVTQLTVNVISDSRRYMQWPPEPSTGKAVVPKGIEMRVEHNTLGTLSKLYRVH